MWTGSRHVPWLRHVNITTLPWASRWLTRPGPAKPPVLMPFTWQNTAAKNVTGFPDQRYKMVTHLSFLSPRLPASIVSSSGCQSCLVARFPAVFETREGEMYPYRAPCFPPWIPQTSQTLHFAITYCLSCGCIPHLFFNNWAGLWADWFETHTHNKLTSIGL